jgi:hypothetical protein
MIFAVLSRLGVAGAIRYELASSTGSTVTDDGVFGIDNRVTEPALRPWVRDLPFADRPLEG